METASKIASNQVWWHKKIVLGSIRLSWVQLLSEFFARHHLLIACACAKNIYSTFPSLECSSLMAIKLMIYTTHKMYSTNSGGSRISRVQQGTNISCFFLTVSSKISDWGICPVENCTSKWYFCMDYVKMICVLMIIILKNSQLLQRCKVMASECILLWWCSWSGIKRW